MPRFITFLVLTLVCLLGLTFPNHVAKAGSFFGRRRQQSPSRLASRQDSNNHGKPQEISLLDSTLEDRQARQLRKGTMQPTSGGHQESVFGNSSNEEDSASSSSSASSGPRGESLKRPRSRLFGTSQNRKHHMMQQRMWHLKSRLQDIASNALRDRRAGTDGDSDKNERLLSALGPSIVALWANRGGGNSDPYRVISFGTVYALALLGSSVGFHSFLYFISVGYALGITLPLMVAMSVYRKQQRQLAFAPMTRSTYLHSFFVILWGLRALGFFLWREYVNWPALHQQIRQVNENNAPTFPVKLVIWIMYSFLYTAMLSPCWFRLRQNAAMLSGGTMKGFRPFRWFYTYLPMLLQLTGLSLETVADYQKSTFKFQNRYEWCHVGLWQWSTHPNYLGELIFWMGTYLGWLLFHPSSSSSSISTLAWMRQFAFATLGFLFITTVLRGSIQSMSNKHWQKYGHIPEYAKFRQTHGLLGPTLQSKGIQETESMVDPLSSDDSNNGPRATSSQQK